MRSRPELKLRSFRNFGHDGMSWPLTDRLLEPLAPVVRPVSRRQGPHGRHLYVVLIDFAALGYDRASVMRMLREKGIGTQVHYIPVHRQPYFREIYGDITLPGADSYYNRCLSLPLFPMMRDGDVHYVVETISRLTAR